jgi:hypothetical protein
MVALQVVTPGMLLVRRREDRPYEKSLARRAALNAKYEQLKAEALEQLERERRARRVAEWQAKIGFNADLFGCKLVEEMGERTRLVDTWRVHPLTDRIVK